MTSLPKDTMIVGIWSKVEYGMDERPGFLIYGLFPEGADPSPRGFPAEVLAGRGELHGEGWRIFIWTFEVTNWPRGAQWQRLVGDLFAAVCDEGAQVAWLGSEPGPVADPPSLFVPEEMSDAVYAYMCQGRFSCPLDPWQPWAAVGNDEMAELRDLAPLAQAGEAF